MRKIMKCDKYGRPFTPYVAPTDKRTFMLEVEEEAGEWCIHRIGKFMGLEQAEEAAKLYQKQIGKQVRPILLGGK